MSKIPAWWLLEQKQFMKDNILCSSPGIKNKEYHRVIKTLHHRDVYRVEDVIRILVSKRLLNE